MTVNCPLCGRHLNPYEIRERENTIRMPNGVEVTICINCGKKKKALEEKLEGASPSQIKLLETEANIQLIDIIRRERR